MVLATGKISDYFETNSKEKILDFLQRDEDIAIEPDWKKTCKNLIEKEILKLEFPKFKDYS